MRTPWSLGAAFLGAAFVLPSLAQQPAGNSNPNQFFTGVDPRQIKSVPIDPGRALRPGNVNGALQSGLAQRANTPFSMGNLFPKLTLGKWPPTRATSFVVAKTPPLMSTTVPKGNVNLFAPTK
jgi:hypothetical protein